MYSSFIAYDPTPSSSINLLDQTTEPLTGRKFVFSLYALSLEELYPHGDIATFRKALEPLLLYGTYPEVVRLSSFAEKKERLIELAESVPYRELLAFFSVKNESLLHKLLRALALQIGSEYSARELSGMLGIDAKTVERYIDLLEKSFIIFRLSPFTKNRRREISRLKKIYFYDVGIRNAIIRNFNPLNSRSDVGVLWENTMIVERMKYRDHHQRDAEQYFWRTYDGAEVDLVEEYAGQLVAYELKWNHPGRYRVPASWREYSHTPPIIITPNTVLDFVFP